MKRGPGIVYVPIPQPSLLSNIMQRPMLDGCRLNVFVYQRWIRLAEEDETNGVWSEIVLKAIYAEFVLSYVTKKKMLGISTIIFRPAFEKH